MFPDSKYWASYGLTPSKDQCRHEKCMVLIKGLIRSSNEWIKGLYWFVGGELFQKLLIKISTLIFLIWIGGSCHQVRQCAVKIIAHHYPLVVPLLIVQLARISLGKILVILLASIMLGKRATILFNGLQSCYTFRFGLWLNESARSHFSVKTSSSLSIALKWWFRVLPLFQSLILML